MALFDGLPPPELVTATSTIPPTSSVPSAANSATGFFFFGVSNACGVIWPALLPSVVRGVEILPTVSASCGPVFDTTGTPVPNAIPAVGIVTEAPAGTE